MKPLVVCVVGLGVLLTALSVSSGEIYQWRDEHGHMRFSDQPPDNGEAEQVRLNETMIYDGSESRLQAPRSAYASGSSAVGTLPAAARATNDNSRYLKEQRAAAVAREAKQAAKRKQQCEQARERYRNVSKLLTGNLDKALKRRDYKNELRDQIAQLCH